MKRLVHAVLIEHVAPGEHPLGAQQRAQVVEQLLDGGLGEASALLCDHRGHGPYGSTSTRPARGRVASPSVLHRWLAAAIAVSAFALVAMPTAGQAPPPPCPAGTQVPPDRFEFTEDPDTSPTQSVAATHPVALFIGVDSGSLTSVTDPSIQIAGASRSGRDPRAASTTTRRI